MRSKIVAAVTLALTTLVAVPALADDACDHAKHERLKFPVPAAEFQAHVNARQAKAQERIEKRAAKLSPAEATALRQRFHDRIAKINAEVAKATADGTVTKEEAQAIRQAVPHHGKHHGRGHKQDEQQGEKK